MRITSEVMVTRSLDRLQTRLQAYERAQSELGTGRRILRPSDDPAGSRRAMSLEAALRAREQDLRNASDAQGWLDTADSALQSALQRLSRVRELALRGASDSGAAERQALAAEVREIAEELQGIANTRHVDRPLFGGFSDGDAVTWDGTEWVFAGTGEQITRRVSDSELVRVNVTAGEWLGTGAGTGNLLGLLEQLATDLEAGTADQVGARVGDLKVASDRITSALGQIGAATNRVESARERATDLTLTLRTELSSVQDVDLAAGMMELQVQQVAYEATLQALAKALPPSLVAFLR
jgi:flagellar hook-associated protein 3 FlgL